MDGRTDGQKIGRLYRTLLQAGAIIITIKEVVASFVADWNIIESRTKKKMSSGILMAHAN